MLKLFLKTNPQGTESNDESSSLIGLTTTVSKVSFTMYQFRGADWIEFTFSITGILIGNNFLSEKHNCRIEWNNPNDEVRHSSLDLESSAAAIDIVTKAIEKAVATSVNSEVMGLMSYESAILNEHYGDVVEVAAKALNPPYFLDKIWMAAVRFADEHTDIMDLVIGSRRSRNTTGRIKGIAGRTNCLIMVKRKVLPHFFCHGKHRLRCQCLCSADKKTDRVGGDYSKEKT